MSARTAGDVADGPVTVPTPGFAAERVTRLTSLSLGVAGIALLGTNVPGAIAQVGLVGVPLTVAVLTVVAGTAITGLLAHRRAAPAVLRRIWRVQSVGLVACTALLPIVLSTRVLPEDDGLTWVSELATLAGCAAVLGWPIRGAVVLGVVLQASLVLTAALHSPAGHEGRAFGDATRALFFVTFFMVIAAVLVRAGAVLDGTVRAAEAEARTFAESEVRRVARDRTDMLVHDTVLVALLAYTTSPGSAAAAEQAGRALGAIDVRGVDPSDDVAPARSPRDLAWALQGVTTAFDPEIRFDYHLPPGDAGSEAESTSAHVPAEVCVAVTEAMSEALRNSLRHAGPDVSRQVDVSVTADAVAVLVLDDGAGFDPDRVAPSRLGIRRGVVGRLEAVPGGGAVIRSALGYGTVVSIRWDRP